MSEKLEKGVQIKTRLGVSLTIEEHLGEGGQGDVYKVDYAGEPKALKWYKKGSLPDDADGFYELIKNNQEKGSPSKEFLWPQDLTVQLNGTFGYVMDLRPVGCYEVSHFMLRKVSFPSFQIAVDTCLNIVTAFRKLHGKGYSYQDMNDGNFFINPKNGKVFICDNDNVAPTGTTTGILGKPGYMAPEVVMGEKTPNTLSDLYSLSVILFILLCSNHPLEGERSLVPCMSPALQRKLHGSEALFIMDPDNKENAPNPAVHKNVLAIWGELPEYMQQIFLKAFCDGLKNPNARPKEIDWLNALTRFRSEIVPCTCKNENFADNGDLPKSCGSCGAELKQPLKLEFINYKIPVVDGARIYQCQIMTSDMEDALNPFGKIVSKGDMLGVKNIGDKEWDATTPSGKSKAVPKGEVVPVKEGISLKMGNATVKIVT